MYISDRKTHSLITPPYHLTSLVSEEEVELKFTAPSKEGTYNFTVCVRSDSYLGVDLLEDIKLDVQKAWEAPKEHKQWDFSVIFQLEISRALKIKCNFLIRTRRMKTITRRTRVRRASTLRTLISKMTQIKSSGVTCDLIADGQNYYKCISSGAHSDKIFYLLLIRSTCRMVHSMFICIMSIIKRIKY